MLPADFDVDIFSVTLRRNDPVSVIAPFIDSVASSSADVVIAGVVVVVVLVLVVGGVLVCFIVEFVWLYTESKVLLLLSIPSQKQIRFQKLHAFLSWISFYSYDNDITFILISLYHFVSSCNQVNYEVFATIESYLKPGI